MGILQVQEQQDTLYEAIQLLTKCFNVRCINLSEPRLDTYCVQYILYLQLLPETLGESHLDAGGTEALHPRHEGQANASEKVGE